MLLYCAEHRSGTQNDERLIDWLSYCFNSISFMWFLKVNEKVHTLDIAPLRSESPPQKRSGMARVFKGFHSFTCTPTRSSAIGMSHTCLCLPSRSWYSFTDPGGNDLKLLMYLREIFTQKMTLKSVRSFEISNWMSKIRPRSVDFCVDSNIGIAWHTPVCILQQPMLTQGYVVSRCELV